MLSRFLLPLCAIVLLSAVLARAEVASHEITSLPGWNGKLPSRHFSGFFPTTINGSSGSSDGMLHYYLTLSESKPETDPLVVWLQGGPGCSSLFGMLYENGQLHFSGDTDKSGLPTLAVNPFAWTKVANMLFLEQPVGVGFSYCSNNCSCDYEGCPFGVDAYNFLVSRTPIPIEQATIHTVARMTSRRLTKYAPLNLSDVRSTSSKRTRRWPSWTSTSAASRTAACTCPSSPTPC